MTQKPSRLNYVQINWISNGNVIATQNYKGLVINSELTTAKTVSDLNEMATTVEKTHDAIGYKRACESLAKK